MKFIISRSSCWGDDRPCEEAYIETIQYDEVCPYDTVEEYNKRKWGEYNWEEKGTNHRVENGKPVRTMTTKKWIIEFSTLEDLMNFVNKDCKVIVDKISGDKTEPYPTIEIYDYWRE